LQVKVQVPAAQPAVPLAGGLGQWLLHAPQLLASVLVLTQAVPHLVSEPVQVKSHVPLLHTAVPPAGAEHVWPQLPQLLTSLLVLTQLLPHFV
jgi:hypothetical protein